MPRYHFDLIDAAIVADASGPKLPNDSEAIDRDGAVVRRLRRERRGLKNRHYAIAVSNEECEDIGRVSHDMIQERIP